MINDLDKFQSFGNSNLIASKPGKFSRYMYLDFDDINVYAVHQDSSVLQNEKNFLDKIGHLPNGSGAFRLFRGNQAMTQFTPITVDGNKNIINDPCN